MMDPPTVVTFSDIRCAIQLGDIDAIERMIINPTVDPFKIAWGVVKLSRPELVKAVISKCSPNTLKRLIIDWPGTQDAEILHTVLTDLKIGFTYYKILLCITQFKEVFDGDWLKYVDVTVLDYLQDLDILNVILDNPSFDYDRGVRLNTVKNITARMIEVTAMYPTLIQPNEDFLTAALRTQSVHLVQKVLEHPGFKSFDYKFTGCNDEIATMLLNSPKLNKISDRIAANAVRCNAPNLDEILDHPKLKEITIQVLVCAMRHGINMLERIMSHPKLKRCNNSVLLYALTSGKPEIGRWLIDHSKIETISDKILIYAVCYPEILKAILASPKLEPITGNTMDAIIETGNTDAITIILSDPKITVQTEKNFHNRMQAYVLKQLQC